MNNNIAKIIQKSLENYLLNMTTRRQFHFAERVYRISGDEWAIPIIKNFLIYDYNLLARLIHSYSSNFSKEYGDKKLEWLASRSSDTKMKRWEFYRSRPEIKYFQEIVFLNNKLHEYGLENTEIYQKAHDILSNTNWNAYLLSPEVLMYDPIQTINTAWWLRDTNVIDLTYDVYNQVKELYPFSNQQIEDPLFLHNQRYAYTHIILAESGYYQRYVNTFSEIQSYLNMLSQTVLSESEPNLDLLCEIGATMKVLKKDLSGIQKTVQKHLDSNTKLLPINPQKEAHFEHAHSLAYVLFSSFDTFHSTKELGKLVENEI